MILQIGVKSKNSTYGLKATVCWCLSKIPIHGDDANKYVNKLIGVPRDVLPTLGDDEHYWVDLIGVEVVNLEQECLGAVYDVAWNGAHPILLVRSASEQELMIPLVPEYVHKIASGSKIQVSWVRDWT